MVVSIPICIHGRLGRPAYGFTAGLKARLPRSLYLNAC